MVTRRLATSFRAEVLELTDGWLFGVFMILTLLSVRSITQEDGKRASRTPGWRRRRLAGCHPNAHPHERWASAFLFVASTGSVDPSGTSAIPGP
jgi:hypothetical protein